MRNAIQFSMTYAHPVEKVWRALTEAEAVSQWLMPTDIKAEVGYRFQFRTKPSPGFDGIVDCEILEVIPQQKLVYSWSGGKSLRNTIVTFQLSEENGHTRLDFSHSGFEGFLNRFFIKRLLAAGWKRKILSRLLPQYLAS